VQGKAGGTRRISYEELKRAGVLRNDEVLAEPAVQELSLRLGRIGDEIHQAELRLSAQLAQIEKSIESLKDSQSVKRQQSDLRAA
jgi:hypothetical protein